jgi:glucokinase
MSFVDGPTLAVVVDSSRLAAGIVDGDGEVLIRDRVGTPNRDVWRSLERLVRRVMAARPGEIPMPVAVGVSSIGSLDLQAGSVTPEAMAAWSSFPLVQHLESLTGLPVALDSTAGAAAEAERWVGGAVGLPGYLTLLLDQAVESACIINDVRLRGSRGNGGSLAHLAVEPDGFPCGCGAIGCLNMYASAAALEAEINRPLRRTPDSVVERTGIMVGRAIASAAAVFDLTTVFISGSVVDTFGDSMLDSMRREIGLRSKLDNLSDLRVLEPSGLIQPLVGAAAVARLMDPDAPPATAR